MKKSNTTPEDGSGNQDNGATPQPACKPCGECKLACGACAAGKANRSLLAIGRNQYVLHVRLEPAAAEFLAERYDAILARNRFQPDRDAREMMGLAGAALRQVLAPPILERLRRFGMGVGEPILVVDGMPKQKIIPPTPFRGFGDESKTAFTDLQLFGVYDVTGVEPLAFDYENNGWLFRNVVPNPDAAGQKSSQGFDADLRWHTDNPCGVHEHTFLQPMPARRSPIPRFLGFGGLRNADAHGHPIPTRVLPVRPVLHTLPSETLAQLGMPAYQVNAPASNRTTPLVGVPLVVSCEGECFIRYNADPEQIFGLTPEAQAALDRFKTALDAADEHVVEVNVEPGRILVFDNYRVAHERSAFDPGTNWAEARWMRRCYACRALEHGNLVDATHCPYLWA